MYTEKIGRKWTSDISKSTWLQEEWCPIVLRQACDSHVAIRLGTKVLVRTTYYNIITSLAYM